MGPVLRDKSSSKAMLMRGKPRNREAEIPTWHLGILQPSHLGVQRTLTTVTAPSRSINKMVTG